MHCSVGTRGRNSDKTEIELLQDPFTFISEDLRMSGRKEIEYYLFFFLERLKSEKPLHEDWGVSKWILDIINFAEVRESLLFWIKIIFEEKSAVAADLTITSLNSSYKDI